ncbi:MAG: SdrD B-like domain-containing protein [Mobilicoccus sp.]|nr:SdrD B-like domain-containing protein [Mobilicoccus sp.]
MAITTAMFMAGALAAPAEARAQHVTIHGFLWHDKNTNFRIDTGEQRLRNKSVTLLNEQDRIVRRVITDQRGYYRFSNIPSGRYTVRTNMDSWTASSGAGALNWVTYSRDQLFYHDTFRDRSTRVDIGFFMHDLKGDLSNWDESFLSFLAGANELRREQKQGPLVADPQLNKEAAANIAAMMANQDMSVTGTRHAPGFSCSAPDCTMWYSNQLHHVANVGYWLRSVNTKRALTEPGFTKIGMATAKHRRGWTLVVVYLSR